VFGVAAADRLTVAGGVDRAAAGGGVDAMTGVLAAAAAAAGVWVAESLDFFMEEDILKSIL
jgi:hypothetical protein